ncbi:MAG: hypothetical protein ACRDGF_07685 [Chloroflexota bacterium]
MSEQAATGAPSWRERAVGEWRRQGLTIRLKQLLGNDVDVPEPHVGTGQSSVLLDGVTFTMKSDTNQLELDTPCPRCKKPQHYGPIESSLEVGRALDTLCRDCEFLVKSGLAATGKA